MLLTQVLATAFVIIGCCCCLVIYIIGVRCYCVVTGAEVDEDKIMDRVYIGVGLMSLIFVLVLFFLIVESIVHLIP